MNYTYNATVVDVIDGDTLRADVDLGFSIWSKMIFRLNGINTPEVVGKNKTEGLKAKQYVIDNLLNKNVVIKTFKDSKEKYGRYLAEIWINDVNFNEVLVKNGYAVLYDGKTPH